MLSIDMPLRAPPENWTLVTPLNFSQNIQCNYNFCKMSASNKLEIIYAFCYVLTKNGQNICYFLQSAILKPSVTDHKLWFTFGQNNDFIATQPQHNQWPKPKRALIKRRHRLTLARCVSSSLLVACVSSMRFLKARFVSLTCFFISSLVVSSRLSIMARRSTAFLRSLSVLRMFSFVNSCQSSGVTELWESNN